MRSASFVSFQRSDCFFDLSELLLDFLTAVWSGVKVVIHVVLWCTYPGIDKCPNKNPGKKQSELECHYLLMLSRNPSMKWKWKSPVHLLFPTETRFFLSVELYFENAE